MTQTRVFGKYCFRPRTIGQLLNFVTNCDYVPYKHKSYPSSTRNEIKIYRYAAIRI